MDRVASPSFLVSTWSVDRSGRRGGPPEYSSNLKTCRTGSVVRFGRVYPSRRHRRLREGSEKGIKGKTEGYRVIEAVYRGRKNPDRRT